MLNTLKFPACASLNLMYNDRNKILFDMSKSDGSEPIICYVHGSRLFGPQTENDLRKMHLIELKL